MDNKIYEFINHISYKYPQTASAALRIFELDPNNGGYRALKHIQDNLSDVDVENQWWSQQLIEEWSITNGS